MVETFPPIETLVRVKWVDIVCHSGWAKLEEMTTVWEKPAKCETIGWLTVVQDSYITIASTRGLPDYTQYITIPTGVIESVESVPV